MHRGGGLSHQTLCHNETNDIQRTNRSPTLAEQKAVTGPRILFAASLVVTAVFAAITLSVLPREALVPVTITFIFLLGALVALVASQTSVSTEQFTYWDAAGLLTAISMIACAMVEPVELAALGHKRTNRPLPKCDFVRFGPITDKRWCGCNVRFVP